MQFLNYYSTPDLKDIDIQGVIYKQDKSIQLEWFMWGNTDKKLKYVEKWEIEGAKENLKVQGREETEGGT